jgi:hypothetical protein
LKSDKQKLSVLAMKKFLPDSSCIFTEKVVNKFWAVTRLEMFVSTISKGRDFGEISLTCLTKYAIFFFNF